jgi:hypothetical protein
MKKTEKYATHGLKSQIFITAGQRPAGNARLEKPNFHNRRSATCGQQTRTNPAFQARVCVTRQPQVSDLRL